jgi:hypothetical protein
MQNYIKIQKIRDVIDVYKNLLNTKKRVFLVLDIDDTVLSTRIGKKFTDDDICELVDIAYEYNKDLLFFLTNRDKSLKSYTRNKLNNSGLLHKEKYINYNIIFSFIREQDGGSLKGPTFIGELNSSGIELTEDDHVVFVDYLCDNTDSIHSSLIFTRASYTIFLFKGYQ